MMKSEGEEEKSATTDCIGAGWTRAVRGSAEACLRLGGA
jgi:hypothetical protein